MLTNLLVIQKINKDATIDNTKGTNTNEFINPYVLIFPIPSEIPPNANTLSIKE
mgnify:CR=1 FL=1